MQSIKKDFFRYVVPSVLGFAVTGLYCFVDAFFVGNRVGDLGIAAINISFAIISLSQALGSGIGLGASVKYTILKSEKKDKQAYDYIGGSFICMEIVSLVLFIPEFFYSQQILKFMGATDTIARIGDIYLKTQAAGTMFSVFFNGFFPVVRNCGGVKVSLIMVLTGCAVNIVLDWLFVWVLQLGMLGASLATVIGQFFGMMIGLVYLISTKNMRTHCSLNKFGKIAFDVLKIGIVPFGLIFAPNITVVLINKACLRLGGEPVLAAYGIIAYLVFIVYMLIQGITDGTQPLISRYIGTGDNSSCRKSENLMLIYSLFIAVVSLAIEIILRRKLGFFMGASDEVAKIVSDFLPVFTLGFVFVAVSRSIASVFYASDMSSKAYLISFAEPLMTFVAMTIMCPSLGMTGVWISNTVAQFAVMIMAILIRIISGKRQ